MAAGDYDRGQMKEVITDGVSRVTTTVQDALKSGDYSNLSRNVSAEMENLFSNIGKTVNVPYRNNGRTYQNQKIPGYGNLSSGANYRNTQTYHRVRDINQTRYQAAQNIPNAVPVRTNGTYQNPVLYKDMKSSKIGALIGTIIGYGFGGMMTLLCLMAFLGSVADGDGAFGFFAALLLFLFTAAGPLVGTRK